LTGWPASRTRCRAFFCFENAGIHKGAVMEKHRRGWVEQGSFHYLPPHSSVLDRIEILCKQAKYFWRQFARVNGADLLTAI